MVDGRVPLRTQGSNGAEQGGGSAASRKKRRRQRGQRNKHRTPGSPSLHGDSANRERVYQDVEGLLRQIRELAEENAAYTQEQLDDFTQSVVTLFKALESEGQMISDRLFADYQRVRDKLNMALRDRAPSPQERRA
ncbi:MAG: hypothetical protein HY270_03900 [Deltaproteobacteria bacterium]|nr:hypothetical protein [Deltaproteobacteria bacterium]